MEERLDVAFAEAHRGAVSAPINELAAELQGLLSRRLTAYIAGVTDAKAVTRWANGDVKEIRDPWVEQRLRATYEVATYLLNFESSATVKAWFIGLNPQLGDEAPVDLLRNNRLKDVLSAARAFAVGG
ncbi:MAG: XRE family transcriptional regulator [Thermomicrobiales bacterium]